MKTPMKLMMANWKRDGFSLIGDSLRKMPSRLGGNADSDPESYYIAGSCSTFILRAARKTFRQTV